MSRSNAAVAVASWLLAVMLPIVPSTMGQSLIGSEADDDDGEFVVRDGDVGYIDSAVLGNVVRLRLDAAYDFDRPNRAEFFYAPSRPVGPGLPRPEIAVDYQQFLFYTEYRTHDNLSLFVELGGLALNPILNETSAGLSDMNAGCKFRLLETPGSLATAQLRIYAPTGDVDRGLGNGHASIEPGILVLHRLHPRWTASGEFRYWTATDGSAFAGELLRYGFGLQYEQSCDCWIEPVVELVGWTVLNGRQSVLTAAGATPTVEDASGDTIINAKLGARVSLTRDSDLYIGYGRALTSDHWYEDTVRVELRYTF
jgi:hypothetical protein